MSMHELRVNQIAILRASVMDPPPTAPLVIELCTLQYDVISISSSGNNVPVPYLVFYRRFHGAKVFGDQQSVRKTPPPLKEMDGPL